MNERKICTKESPHVIGMKDDSQWQHPDARETAADSDHYIEYHCPNCGLTFRCEMPD